MTKEGGLSYILTPIACSCTTDCGNRCSLRNDLTCTLTYKKCVGDICYNQRGAYDEPDDYDDEEKEKTRRKWWLWLKKTKELFSRTVISRIVEATFLNSSNNKGTVTEISNK